MKHAHHWIITAQNNCNALGVCKHCGETRIFPNILPDDAKVLNKRFGNYMFGTKKRKRNGKGASQQMEER